jgi:hypothetical protein
MRMLLAALLLGVAGMGCGEQQGVPRAAPPPGPVLGDDADGTTVHLVRGQHLQVRLSRGSYDPPMSSRPASVVRRRTAGGYPGTHPVEADFQALASGPAEITATTDAGCLHGRPRCLIPQRLWTLHVVVR